MSETLDRIKALIAAGKVRVSEHGYDELSADGIGVRDLVNGVDHALLLEDYPDYPKGPCVLVLQKDPDSNPIHAVWGLHKGASEPAVLVTAYRPDPKRWNDDFTRRAT